MSLNKMIKEYKKDNNQETSLTYQNIQFNVLNYISIEEKIALVNEAISFGLTKDDDDRLQDFNQSYADMYLRVLILMRYTDLTLPMKTFVVNGQEKSKEIDLIKTYDLMENIGLFDYICEEHNKFYHEYQVIEDIYLNEIEEIIRKIDYNHSLTNQVEAIFDKIKDVLNDIPTEEAIQTLVKETKNDINNIDMDKLSILKSIGKNVQTDDNKKAKDKKATEENIQKIMDKVEKSKGKAKKNSK